MAWYCGCMASYYCVMMTTLLGTGLALKKMGFQGGHIVKPTLTMHTHQIPVQLRLGLRGGEPNFAVGFQLFNEPSRRHKVRRRKTVVMLLVFHTIRHKISRNHVKMQMIH